MQITHKILQELKIKQKEELERLKKENLEQYVVKGSEAEWNSALSSNRHSENLVSVKTGEKRPTENNSIQENQKKYKKKKKRFSSHI